MVSRTTSTTKPESLVYLIMEKNANRICCCPAKLLALNLFEKKKIIIIIAYKNKLRKLIKLKLQSPEKSEKKIIIIVTLLGCPQNQPRKMLTKILKKEKMIFFFFDDINYLDGR